MNATAEPDYATATLDMVLFTAGGWRVGLEARHVCGSRPALSLSADPRSTATADAATWFGLTPMDEMPAARQCLTLKPLPPDDVREIQVAVPVDLVSLPARVIHALPPLLAARTRLLGLRALALAADPLGTDRLILLFDTTRLRACPPSS